MFYVSNYSTTIHGIIRREAETILYLTLPVNAHRLEVQWARDILTKPVQMDVQMVTLPMYYMVCNNMRTCTVCNHYDVDRIVTVMYTEPKPTCLS